METALATPKEVGEKICGFVFWAEPCKAHKYEKYTAINLVESRLIWLIL